MVGLSCINQSVLTLLQSLASNTGTIRAGDMEMQADDFFLYLQRQHDDAPLYLFDQHFADRSPALANDYCTPAVFPQPSPDEKQNCSGRVLQYSFPDSASAHHVHLGDARECDNAGDDNRIGAEDQAQKVDLFALLDESRPSFRWLIIGGKRSGSTFHVDPNGTSAWNACIRGRKLWYAEPSSCIDV
jgi:hypothetical protein